MSDFERAKALLKENPACTCAFVRGETERVSELHGVRPLMELINAGENLKGYAAADRIVGRAAALLYAYLGVEKLFAEVLSRSAEEVLKAHHIPYASEVLTEGIINRAGNGPCPMEQATQGIVDPEEGINAIRVKLKELQNKKPSV